jgi:thiol:disulfide interchange protein
MHKAIFGLVAVVSILASPLNAEFRSWSNLEGVKIDAELVKAEGENVTFRLRNGKLTTFAKTKLSFADQDLVKEDKATPTTATAPETKPTVDANRKARWLTKMEKAQEQSKETGLPILVLFTGTSWCPYCIKLEEVVFSKSEFKTFADKNLVLLILDFGPGGTPSNKKDGALSKEFGVSGFPTYFLADAAGKPMSTGGYHDGMTPSSFASWVKSAAPNK